MGWTTREVDLFRLLQSYLDAHDRFDRAESGSDQKRLALEESKQRWRELREARKEK